MIIKDTIVNGKVVLAYNKLNTLLADLTNTNIIEWFANKFTGDPFNAILSVCIYPFDVKELLNIPDTEFGWLWINGQGMKDPDETPAWLKGYNVGARGSINALIDIGELDFRFIDIRFELFEPYSKLDIYLPYIGFVSVPPSQVIGYKIKVKYGIDFDNGNCSAFIYRQREVDGSLLDDLFMVQDGHIGVQIPLGRTDQNQLLDNIFSTGIQVAAGIVSGGISAMANVAVGEVLESAGAEYTVSAMRHETTSKFQNYQNAVGVASNFASNVVSHRLSTTKGQYSGRFTSSLPLTANLLYAIFETTNVYEPTDYARTKGKPLMESRVFGDLTGFTVVESVHLENFGNATSDELSEIESILLSGIIL